jgi:two-component system response regulator MtrA
VTDTILVVEDEPRTAQWTKTYIERAGYRCLVTDNGIDALRIAQQENPDLIVLDLMLPELDGWEVCQQLRRHSSVPIIMVTARVTDQDIIEGLRMGADDYVKKPTNLNELVARIEANLRRSQGQLGVDDCLQVGMLRFDLKKRLVYREEKPISLSARQFDLLLFLARHPKQVFTRDQLIENVFGNRYDSYDRAIDVQIRRLRKRLEEDPSNPMLIESVYGVGYRLNID